MTFIGQLKYALTVCFCTYIESIAKKLISVFCCTLSFRQQSLFLSFPKSTFIFSCVTFYSDLLKFSIIFVTS